MKKNEATIFILIASVLIGFLIASNLKIGEGSTFNYLDSKEYSNQYNKKLSLINEIDDLYKKYNELKDKEELYTDIGVEDPKVQRQLERELLTYKGLAGMADIRGPGVVITLDDAKDVYATNYDLIHDSDIRYIVNDLKVLGAEAIAINKVRVLDTTEIKCYGALIKINGIVIPAPFTIEAIGDIEKLTAVNSSEYYFGALEFYRSGLIREFEEKNDIVINALSDERDYKYMKEVK